MSSKTIPAGLLALLLAAAAPHGVQAEARAAHVARADDMLAAMFDASRDFATDPDAQRRYLAPKLVEAVAGRDAFAKARSEAMPDERTDPPSSEAFLDAWDRPSAYAILGSRAYGDVAWVDVRYTWGPATNYPGESRLASLLLHRIDGAWRLADIYDHASEFHATPSTLLERLADRTE
jgi:hypothetical protein